MRDDNVRNPVGKGGDSDFAARLKFALGPMPQAELARLSGSSTSNINGYLSGRIPAFPVGMALARALGVSPVWLATGEGPCFVGEGELASVRRFEVTLSAGAGAWQDRAREKDPLAFNRDFLARLGAPGGDGLIILDVAGDSMDPTIRDGAVALIDTRDLRYADGIWAFAMGDQLRVKRLRRGLRELQVISDNPVYPAETITAADEEQLKLIGRVRWVGQML